MSKNIITVSREFGSGGRSIAKQVAESLGWTYYDKELVKQVAFETGLSESFIEEEGEYAPNKSWLSYIFSSHSGTPGVMNGLSIDDFLWVMQRKIVLDIAEKGNCVIVGRCADFILKDQKDCLHVFIHSNMDARAERIVRMYGESESTPKKRLEDKDKSSFNSIRATLAILYAAILPEIARTTVFPLTAVYSARINAPKL